MFSASTFAYLNPTKTDYVLASLAAHLRLGQRCIRDTSLVGGTTPVVGWKLTSLPNVQSVIDSVKVSNGITGERLTQLSPVELKKLVNELNEVERIASRIIAGSSYTMPIELEPSLLVRESRLTTSDLQDVVNLRRRRIELLRFEPGNSTEYSANQKERREVSYRLYEITNYYPYKPQGKSYKD